jgi:hypothetical protein
MMSKVLGRIQKLLALASGDDEEARTAAHMAAKLIREHKVVLSLPGKQPGSHMPAGYEDLAVIYNMMGVAPQGAPAPNRRTPAGGPRHASRPKAQPRTDESVGPRPQAHPVEPTSPAHDPFDFVTAAEASKRVC